MELAAGAFDQKMYVWRSDGTRFAPWPIAIYDAGSTGGVNPVDPEEIISLPLIADIDADGIQELVFGTNETYSTPAPLPCPSPARAAPAASTRLSQTAPSSPAGR